MPLRNLHEYHNVFFCNCAKYQTMKATKVHHFCEESITYDVDVTSQEWITW